MRRTHGLFRRTSALVAAAVIAAAVPIVTNLATPAPLVAQDRTIVVEATADATVWAAVSGTAPGGSPRAAFAGRRSRKPRRFNPSPKIAVGTAGGVDDAPKRNRPAKVCRWRATESSLKPSQSERRYASAPTKIAPVG